MANEEQVALLEEGVEVWNQWREENPDVAIDLSNADLSDACLIEANLSNAYLVEANLSNADLSKANFSNAELSKANLSNAYFGNADLAGAYLSNAYLVEANLSDADLSNVYLFEANLSDADLQRARVLYADFTQASLTGACIADWQIGSSTNLDNVKCDYIFRTCDEEGTFSGRLPVDPDSTFAPGEFTQRFQIIASALETIDITFTEGIDWKAFFQSFQELRQNRANEAISIQGMERKGNAFVVRLEVETEVDKATIETQLKQFYAQQLATLETQYQEQLRLRSEEIAHYRQTHSSLLHIVQTMAEKDSISQTFHGPVGNVSGTNHGTMTAYINQNHESISQLIAALRATAQTFPAEQKEEVQMELDDLEADLSKPEKQEPKRIGKRLQRLIAAGTAAATIAGGAVKFSDNINKFTDNVVELGEKIGLTKEQIQPSQETP